MFKFKSALLERGGDEITITCSLFDLNSINNDLTRSILHSQHLLEAYVAKGDPHEEFVRMMEIAISDAQQNMREFQAIRDERNRLIQEKESAA